MAYKQITFTFRNSREVSLFYDGRYGARGEKRAPKRKATPEQIQKQNQHNRERTVRHYINENFTEEDYWVTLKYPAGTKKSVPEMREDFTKFCRKMRYRYKKAGEEFKYIYRMEVGRKGGLHVHILLNRIENTDLYIKDCWIGHPWITTLYDEGGQEKLAEYITKKPDDEIKGQLSFFPEEEREDLVRYGVSRNLRKPVPEVKEYSRKTVKKEIELIESGDYMKLATPGFYIDKNSIRIGVNPYTGRSYLHYTERRIRREHVSHQYIHTKLNPFTKAKERKNHIPPGECG